jgi:MYXO-CTERM domain-containing protein
MKPRPSAASAGYLSGMQIGPRSCISTLALVVVGGIFASPAAAAPATSSGQTAAVVEPIPAASWHGRAIRRPDQAGRTLAASQTSTAAPLRYGAGFEQPGGSSRVIEVQRLLHHVGYRPGPVDGLFGPLTRASVQWFQIKHGIRPSGVVDGVTLALLRLRAHGDSPTPLGTTPPAPPSVVNAPAAPARVPAARTAAHDSGNSAKPVVITAALVGLLLLAGLLLVALRRRRSSTEASSVKSDPPAASPAPPPAVPALPQTGAIRVVGYANGSDRRESRRQAHAIEKACSERGWTVAHMVTEGRAGAVKGRRRAGLHFALKQLEQGAGTRLVACSLEDVSHSRRELSALIEWCARTGVELVALDETSARPRLSRRRRANAPVAGGELAPRSSP